MTSYAEIVAIANDVTDASEDGGFRFNILSNNVTSTVIEMEASGGNVQLGFFGVAPVVQQSPAANSAAIISALESLGLFV